MGVVKIVIALASAAYSYYANKKMLDDMKKKPTSDDRPTSTTTRGAFLPLLIGRRRVAPVISWLSDRYTDRYGTVLESAGHLLCIGPASRIHHIMENGKIIFAQLLESSTVPSGSTFSTANGRTFTVYWGDNFFELPYDNKSGTFQEGEVVTGGTSGAKAFIQSLNGGASPLVVYNPSGTFQDNEEITGGTSAATADVDNLTPEDAATGLNYNNTVSASTLTDVPSEIGSLFPRICYIKWTNTILEGSFWPDFTYDIEVDTRSNSDDVGTTIIGMPPEVGTYLDIDSVENGYPGQNFIEVNGDVVSEYLGEVNAAIKYVDIPELFYLGWNTYGSYHVSSVDPLNGTYLPFTYNSVGGNPGGATFDLTAFPSEGKTVRVSCDVNSGSTRNRIRILTDSGTKGSILYLGIPVPEVLTGNVRFSKYPTKVNGVEYAGWTHYDIIFTVEDNIDFEEDWQISFDVDISGGFFVGNIDAQSYIEYDVRRVVRMDNLGDEAQEKDLSQWSITEYTKGTVEYINDSDPNYQDPPAEATDDYQNRITVDQPGGNLVWSRDSRGFYPSEIGNKMSQNAYIKMSDGILTIAAERIATTDIWWAVITAEEENWTYETDSVHTEVRIFTTSKEDWFKVEVEHTIQASEAPDFGNLYYTQIKTESVSEDTEVWIQNVAFFSSQSDIYKTRIELNEEINTLVSGTGEVAPIRPEVIGGANAAGAIHQLLFSNYPYGVALNKSDYDLVSLAEVSNVMASESLPMSILADEGKDLEAVLANILQDTGVMMFWDIYQGLFSFKAIREVSEDEIREIGSLKRKPQVTVRHDDYISNQFVFSFSDVARKYKETTLIYDNDGEISPDYGQTKRSSQVRIPTVISFEVAKTISERRAQEEMGKPTMVTIQVMRGLRFNPGNVITTPYTSQDIRVLGIVDDGEDNEVTLECASVFYGLPDATSVLESGGGSGIIGQVPDLDDAFRILELPRFLSANQNKIFSPRVRGSLDIIGAKLFLSTNGSSYNEDITSNVALAGGILNEDIALDTDQLMSSGPVINIQGPDVLEVLDLTGSETDFRRGRQVVLIGNEFFFCESVTVLSTSQLRLGRLIRGRYATSIATHSIGDQVYIWQDDDIRISDLLPAAGADLYLKTQPFNSFSSVDLAEVTPDNRTILGDGTRPPAPYGINTPEGSRAWVAGEDIVLKWAYRNGNVPGAGEIIAGETSETAEPEGTFTLKIYDSTGSTLKRTETGLLLPTYTYTNANLVSDFSGEPSEIQVRVINIASTGLSSDEPQQQIEKV